MELEGFLLKFGKDSDIDQLQKQGLVYCNPINYFKSVEGDEIREDTLETANFIATKKTTIELWPVEKPENKIQIQASHLYNHIISPFGNLYCMYGLDTSKIKNKEKFKIDSRFIKNSESFLFIISVKEFLERLHSNLEKTGKYWEHKMIEYKDFSNFYGERTIFQKDAAFSYQNEFRVYIQNDNNDPLKIEIGDISDISIKYPSSMLETAYFMKNK